MKPVTLLLLPPVVAALALLAATPTAARQDPRAWVLFDDAPQPYLQYGKRVGADPDATQIGCSGRRGVMTVTQSFKFNPKRMGATGLMTIYSGAKDLEISARASADAHDGRRTVLEADLAAASPMMASFGKTGDLRLAALGTNVRPPAAPMDMVGKLMRICGR
ncbi:hypothetical protein ACO2Q3_20310 [Caulobacter sp. KR2-114]|uniref:hypothetical protein n=1 Tax=Caulobacter sp. KR2-114 TaxID=3400912 RepID=UPI003C079155